MAGQYSTRGFWRCGNCKIRRHLNYCHRCSQCQKLNINGHVCAYPECNDPLPYQGPRPITLVEVN